MQTAILPSNLTKVNQMAFETLEMPRFRDFGRNHENLSKSCIFPLFLDRFPVPIRARASVFRRARARLTK